MSIDELYRHSRNAAFWGIVISLSLGAAKLVGGMFGHSFALVSDSIHSLGDALVSFVVWGALHWSQVPPDPEHPYGHTRGEAVAGSNIALLLVISALWIVWESVISWNAPSEAPADFAVVIAGASVVLKEALFRYSYRIAQRTGSSALQATAWDHRADAFSSLVVLVGLALFKWGGTAFHSADHVAAIIVAVTILWTGGSLFWKSFQELMDRQAPPALLDAVRSEAMAVSHVQNVEKLLIRKTGLEYLVDIHVEVDPNMTVRQGHAIAHAVKDRIVRRIVPVKDVLVHIEPASDSIPVPSAEQRI